MIGYAFCGSFCTFERSIGVLEGLVCGGYDILPIFSFNVQKTDSRFGKSKELTERICSICKRSAITTIEGAEPLGPRIPLDALIIAPCTGNTLAKLAHGITDTPVTMAAKAHLRCERPLLISLASNDALSANLSNIGALMNRKNIYFVPMEQDDPVSKPFSLVASFERIPEALDFAMEGKQLRPVFL